MISPASSKWAVFYQNDKKEKITSENDGTGEFKRQNFFFF